MTFFLVLLVVVNLVTASRDAWVPAGVLRFLAAASAAGTWTLALLYLVYRVPPPLVSSVVVALLYTISFFLAGRSEPAR